MIFVFLILLLANGGSIVASVSTLVYLAVFGGGGGATLAVVLLIVYGLCWVWTWLGQQMGMGRNSNGDEFAVTESARGIVWDRFVWLSSQLILIPMIGLPLAIGLGPPLPILWTIFTAILGVLAGAGVLLLILLLIFSDVMIVFLFLQFFGVVKGVPFTYNARNLLVRWRVTLLTAVAFTLVVGLLTVMAAFVNGMYKLTEGSGHPENIIVMADGSTDELFSNLSYGDITEIDTVHPNHIPRNAEGKPLISHELYLVVNQPVDGAKSGGRSRRFIQVRGMDEPSRSADVHFLKLKEGDWFSGGVVKIEGDPAGAIPAVLGEGIARELGKDLGKDTLKVGDLFNLGPRKWSVAGILNSGGTLIDSEIWTGRITAGDTFGKPFGRTSVVIRTDSAASAADIAKDLSENYKKPAVKAQVETAYYESLNATNQQFLYAVVVVAIIMAVGGIFGVMNTMYAAISQRMKDIGVLRIIGYSRRQVLLSFFFESLLLALIGGILGCCLGYFANGYTASSIVSGGQGGGKSVVLKLVVDGKLLGIGLLFSLLMGCIGGLVPALSAMRLRALESLR